MTKHDPLLVPGQTCWRLERANRVAFIVDAADYFRLAKAAMLKARHNIILVGWDFDTRIKFEPEGSTLEGPNLLGEFLSWLPKHRPDLRVYVLKWDLGVIQAVGRGMTPVFVANWLTNRRLRFKLDGVHPHLAAHHQKIICIDDALAFCGGIDMTVDRWDTRSHLDDNPRRTKPNGHAYGPWHDATMAVDGQAARALGELVRDRWHAATGERLPFAPRDSTDPYPSNWKPAFSQVDVAIARTMPALGERKEIREIERLYLTAIARAERTIYLESQYLASRTLAEALAARLGEPDGPEVVIILPNTADGWLEHETMDGARFKLLHLLWRADVHKRFRAYHPVTEGGNPIYVHAKIMVIDDKLFRVGSSNLNNRSMGFDSECDLAVEVTPDSPDELKTTIAAVRTDLLCEHLAVGLQEFNAALDASGSLNGCIESLRGSGKTLVPFEASKIGADESSLAENELMDPERTPPGLKGRIFSRLQKVIARS